MSTNSKNSKNTTKTPTTDYIVLGPTALRKIEDLWLRRWDAGKELDRPGAEIWYNVFREFLAQRGDELIPSALIDDEHKVMERGLSQEYMAALAQVVDASDARSEYDKAVLILTATPEARREALTRITAAEWEIK